MCLDRILNEPIPEGEIEAYKIFSTDFEELRSIYCSIHKRYKVNTWIRDDNNTVARIFAKNENWYYPGFHCYESPEAAQERCIYTRYWKVYRVKIRNIVCVGIEMEHRVYVAREMFICA